MKCLVKYFFPLFIRLFVLLLSSESSLYNLDSSPSSDTELDYISSHSVPYLFILLMTSFEEQKFLDFDEV